MPANLAVSRVTASGVRMAYAGLTGGVWHNTGEDVGDRQTAEAIGAAADIDHAIVVVQGTYQYNGATRPSRSHSIIDAETGQEYGTASKSYRPIQFDSIAEAINAILGDGAHAETAGALGDGAHGWIACHLQTAGMVQVGKGDAVKPYLFAHWGHDGRTPLTFRLTGTRPVCQNTVNVCLSTDKAAVRITHKGDATARIAEAREALGIVSAQVPAMAKAYAHLAATPVTTARAKEYFAEVFPYAAAAKALAGESDNDTIARIMGGTSGQRELSEAAKAAMAKVDEHRGLLLTLFEGAGIGADLDGARGTAWGAYNAVTEWIDHAYPVLSNGKASRDRLESAMVGAYADKRAEAFDLAMLLAR